MKNRTITVMFAFILFSCSSSQVLLHSNKDDGSLSQSRVILNPSHYSSEKGKNLASMYKSNLNNIFVNIKAEYNHKELNFYPISELRDDKFKYGIGFFRETIDASDNDNRFLGIAVKTDYVVENGINDETGNQAGTLNMYRAYIRDLLGIITKENLVIKDKNVYGISISLAWTVKNDRENLVVFLIRTTKENALDYVERKISTQQFLSKCNVEQSRTDLYNNVMQTINLNIASISKESILKEKPDADAPYLMTLSKDTEVNVLDFKEGYFEIKIRNTIGYLPQDAFHIVANLQQMTERYKEEYEEKQRKAKYLSKFNNMRAKIESNMLWIKPYIANIRESNSSVSPIIDKLWRGSFVYVQEKKGDWYKILYGSPSSVPIGSVNKPSDLISQYDHGWIHKNITSNREVSFMSDEKIRRYKYVMEHPEIKKRFKDEIVEGNVILGMSKEMVLEIMGKPGDVNRSVGSWGSKEQWVYPGIYMYFKNDTLTSWQD